MGMGKVILTGRNGEIGMIRLPSGNAHIREVYSQNYVNDLEEDKNTLKDTVDGMQLTIGSLRDKRDELGKELASLEPKKHMGSYKP